MDLVLIILFLQFVFDLENLIVMADLWFSFARYYISISNELFVMDYRSHETDIRWF
jgi:hypothetical protein